VFFSIVAESHSDINHVCLPVQRNDPAATELIVLKFRAEDCQ